MSDKIAESGYEKSYHDGFWLVYDQRVNNREQAHLSGLRAVAEAAWDECWQAAENAAIGADGFDDVPNPYREGTP